ncbi:lysis system i-spanin subunit Rz [Aquipseudomonas campi]
MNSYLLGGMVICVLVMWGGWQKIQRQEQALAQAAESIATLERAAKSRRQTQRLLLDLDTQHTLERERANQTNADLRADVATGKRRLSVLATSCSVRTATSTAGLADDQARADIDPAAAERIVRITNDGDDAIRQLSALQGYVGRICLPATSR